MDPNEYSEIKPWVQINEDFDSFDFLKSRCSLGEWLAISRVFRPHFIEVDDCILWEHIYEEENFRTWYTHLAGDLTRIEATLNQLSLWHYIDLKDTAEDDRAAMEVAQAIAKSWYSALKESFSDREFDVVAHPTEDGPIVSFVTIRPDPAPYNDIPPQYVVETVRNTNPEAGAEYITWKDKHRPARPDELPQ
jgi:hypothetical protein